MKPHKSAIRTLNTYLLFLLFSIFSVPAYASNPTSTSLQNAINQQDRLSREQQNKIEEEEKEQTLNTLRKERKARKSKASKNKKEEVAAIKAPQCFPLKEVKLVGASLISKKTQDNLTRPFLGKCLDGKTLLELSGVISLYYHQLGYVAAQVSVPKQNIQSGSLELKIMEGKIEKIILGKDKLTDRTQSFMAFGNLEGNILNIDDLNQGIYQLNRLSSNNATLKMEPGELEGGSKVLIENNKSFPLKLNAKYDNLGSAQTGINEVGISASLDNLLSLSDNINLSYNTGVNNGNSHNKDVKSLSGSISIPWGYNSFSYDSSRSQFMVISQGKNVPITSSGYSTRNGFTASRVLFSKNNSRLSFDLSLVTKRSSSYVSGEEIGTHKSRLTVGGVALVFSSYFGDGNNLYLKPSFLQGLKLFGAEKDQPGLDAANPKAQFRLFKLYASLSKKITIPKLGDPLIFSSELDSQLAKSTLYGSERFSVGGYSSVRGFRENNITGDSGYYLRNKLSFGLSPVAKALSKFKLEPFYDYGHVQIKYSHQGGRLSGAGIRTVFESRHFNASLTYALALQKSSLITPPANENKMIYFELNAGI